MSRFEWACEFRRSPHGGYYCRFCGYGPATATTTRRCPAKAKGPGLIAKVAHYAQAMAGWAREGFPTRTDSQVEEILTKQCQPCEHYDALAGRCTRCGCRANATGPAFLNKIRAATEHCPEGKW